MSNNSFSTKLKISWRLLCEGKSFFISVTKGTLGTNIAKAWFTNYKVFESDDTHEAKDGYEWSI